MGSLGWTEILMILVVALIIFGPRKLPELGKTLGNSLAQFRRASEDFKRTWENEVEVEKRRSYNDSYELASNTEPSSTYSGDPYEPGAPDGDTGDSSSASSSSTETAESAVPSEQALVDAPAVDTAGSPDSTSHESGAEVSRAETERA